MKKIIFVMAPTSTVASVFPKMEVDGPFLGIDGCVLFLILEENL